MISIANTCSFGLLDLRDAGRSRHVKYVRKGSRRCSHRQFFLAWAWKDESNAKRRVTDRSFLHA